MNKETLKAKYGDEKVLCIKNDNIKRNNNISKLELIRYYGYLDYRYNAELNFNAKQVIPYLVVKSGDKIFVTKRLNGDSRLVGGYSIGMGGHIDSSDVIFRSDNLIDGDMTVGICIDRELTEETNIDIGRIVSIKLETDFIDESNEVSRVHMCLLYTVDVGDFEVTIKEIDKLEGSFMTIDEIREIYDTLEGWSKIAVDLLFPIKEDVVVKLDNGSTFVALKPKTVSKRGKRAVSVDIAKHNLEDNNEV